jgi:hypothetical protein
VNLKVLIISKYALETNWEASDRSPDGEKQNQEQILFGRNRDRFCIEDRRRIGSRRRRRGGIK